MEELETLKATRNFWWFVAAALAISGILAGMYANTYNKKLGSLRDTEREGLKEDVGKVNSKVSEVSSNVENIEGDIIVVNKELDVKGEQIKGIREDAVKNSYENKKIAALKEELKLIAKSNWGFKGPTIQNIHPNATTDEIKLLAQFLKEDVAQMDTEGNWINYVAMAISKIFDDPRNDKEFEKVIKDIVDNKEYYSDAAKVRLIHGVQSYFYSRFNDKKDLKLYIILNTVGLWYKGESVGSISQEYFRTLLYHLEENNKQEYIDFLNNKDIIDELEVKGVIAEFIEVNAKQLDSSNSYLKKNINGSYLAKVIQEIK